MSENRNQRYFLGRNLKWPLKELVYLGFERNFIWNFQKYDKRISVDAISLKSSSYVKDVCTIEKIFNLKTVVRRQTSTLSIQFFSCQRFGHSILRYGHHPKCVKCCCNHPSHFCTKGKQIKTTCLFLIYWNLQTKKPSNENHYEKRQPLCSSRQLYGHRPWTTYRNGGHFAAGYQL